MDMSDCEHPSESPSGNPYAIRAGVNDQRLVIDPLFDPQEPVTLRIERPCLVTIQVDPSPSGLLEELQAVYDDVTSSSDLTITLLHEWEHRVYGLLIKYRNAR